MGYCIGGELFNRLRRQGHFKEDEAIFYAGQIALAINYLHQVWERGGLRMDVELLSLSCSSSSSSSSSSIDVHGGADDERCVYIWQTRVFPD